MAEGKAVMEKLISGMNQSLAPCQSNLTKFFNRLRKITELTLDEFQLIIKSLLKEENLIQGWKDILEERIGSNDGRNLFIQRTWSELTSPVS